MWFHSRLYLNHNVVFTLPGTIMSCMSLMNDLCVDVCDRHVVAQTMTKVLTSLMPWFPINLKRFCIVCQKKLISFMPTAQHLVPTDTACLPLRYMWLLGLDNWVAHYEGRSKSSRPDLVLFIMKLKYYLFLIVARLRIRHAQYDFWAINVLCILAVVVIFHFVCKQPDLRSVMKWQFLPIRSFHCMLCCSESESKWQIYVSSWISSCEINFSGSHWYRSRSSSETCAQFWC